MSEKYVYFIKPVGMDGPIKIGCSDKPQKRLMVCASWSPFPLELIGTVAGGFADERALHHRFSDLHTRKEWFMSSPALRHVIEVILAGTPIKEAIKAIEPKAPIAKKQPLRTPDRELFLKYGHRIRNACHKVWHSGQRDRAHRPADVGMIMHNWRRDKMSGHLPITPTPEQFARLEEFLADPARHCISIPWQDAAGLSKTIRTAA